MYVAKDSAVALGACAETEISSIKYAVVPSHAQIPTSCAAVVAVMLLDAALTSMRSMRRPFTLTGVSSTMFAAAKLAVAVGARVVQADAAARDSDLM